MESRVELFFQNVRGEAKELFRLSKKLRLLYLKELSEFDSLKLG